MRRSRSRTLTRWLGIRLSARRPPPLRLLRSLPRPTRPRPPPRRLEPRPEATPRPLPMWPRCQRFPLRCLLRWWLLLRRCLLRRIRRRRRPSSRRRQSSRGSSWTRCSTSSRPASLYWRCRWRRWSTRSRREESRRRPRTSTGSSPPCSWRASSSTSTDQTNEATPERSRLRSRRPSPGSRRT